MRGTRSTHEGNDKCISGESWSRNQVMRKCNIIKSPKNRVTTTTTTTTTNNNNNNNNNAAVVAYGNLIAQLFQQVQKLQLYINSQPEEKAY
jgi:hypothetical protein